MKKLFILLALCMIVSAFLVACNNQEQPPKDGTSDVSTQAPTTQEPTTQDPATENPTTEEPTTGEPTTEEPTTEEPTTQEPTTEEPTTEEPPVVEPPVDPNAPVHMVLPDFLANYANQTGNLTCNQHLGACEVKTEGGRTFFRMTTSGGDPYIAFIDGGKNLVVGRYMVVSYRTNSTKDGQFFMGSGQGWTGAGDSFMQAWTEGDWQLAIIDLENLEGVTSIQQLTLNYARIDFFTDKGNDGDYFDIEYIGFFNSVEAAGMYDYELHKAPMWDADKSVLAHVNWDQLYLGTGNADNSTDTNVFFAPGSAASWNKVADMTAYSANALTYWGWAAFKGELGAFGYQIDYNAPIYSDEFAFVGADHDAVVGAAKNGGGDSGHRMKIAINIAGLEGEHTVRVLYKNAAGEAVCMTEFQLIMPVVSHQNGYTTDIGSNFASAQDNVDLKNSDLANLFDQINYGAGEPMYAVYNSGNFYYGVSSFTSMHTQPNGWYAFNVNVLESSGNEGQASIFVRGIRAASLENQYYGQDGHDGGEIISMGGAGIYLNPLSGGKLRINIKTFVDGAFIPNVYYVTIDSTDITVADNGSVVTILAGGKKVATIEIIGTKTYDIKDQQGVAVDLPEGALAEKAILTLADGTVVELENACVAAGIAGSDVGVATRTGNLKFKSASLKAYNSIQIPDGFYTPVPKVNVALDKYVYSDSIENQDNLPWKATDGKETTRWGAKPNGVANLILDLEGVYKLNELKVVFENASWNYEIAFSVDGNDYQVIYTGEPHGANTVDLESEEGVDVRYIKFTRLDDSESAATPHWFSIYEIYAYGELIGQAAPNTPATTFKPETFAQPTEEELAAGYTYDIGAGQFFDTCTGSCTYVELSGLGAEMKEKLQAAGFGDYAYFATDHISLAPVATEKPITYTFRIFDMYNNISLNSRAFLLLNLTNGQQNSAEVAATVEADAEYEGVYYVTFTETAPINTNELKFYELDPVMFYIDTLTVKVG